MADRRMTPSLIAKGVTLLMRHQIWADDTAFITNWRTRLDRFALEQTFENFEENYLAEATDTMANINEPLWPIHRWPYFELPPQVQAHRLTYRCLTIRVCMGYDIRFDVPQMQIDAVWNPSDTEQSITRLP